MQQKSKLLYTFGVKCDIITIRGDNMKKRKTMAFLYTIITVACMFAAAVFVFNSDRRFSVKNQPFVATELDYAFCQATEYSADSVMNYVLSNNKYFDK